MERIKEFLQKHPVISGVAAAVTTGVPLLDTYWGLFSDQPLIEGIQGWLEADRPMSVPSPTIGEMVAFLPTVVGLALLIYIVYLQRHKPDEAELQDAVDTLHKVGIDLENALDTIQEIQRRANEAKSLRDESFSEQKEQLGLFDLLDRTQEASNEIVRLTNELTRATVAFGETIGQRAKELNALDPRSPTIASDANHILRRAAREVRGYADEVEEIESPLEKSLELVFDGWLRAADLLDEDFETDMEEVRETRDKATELQGSVSTAAEAVRDFEATIDSWPRISKEIIHAKARATAVLRRLHGLLSHAASQAGEVASQFDNML